MPRHVSGRVNIAAGPAISNCTAVMVLTCDKPSTRIIRFCLSSCQCSQKIHLYFNQLAQQRENYEPSITPAGNRDLVAYPKSFRPAPRRDGRRQRGGRQRVSIHAARAGGDSGNTFTFALYIVSIHAARAGGDQVSGILCGTNKVSIHAARAGGDEPHQTEEATAFQSTPPARAATRLESGVIAWNVSIHAARAGGDASQCDSRFELSFNPRRPRGRRHEYFHLVQPNAMFQSTPPARAATYRQPQRNTRWNHGSWFQSTPPARAATLRAWHMPTSACAVSIHAARAGGD